MPHHRPYTRLQAADQEGSHKPVYLASPTDFAGVDDNITNLTKEGKPGIEITERAP